MFEGLLLRFGDLTLKGKNQKYFVRAVNTLIREKLEGLNISYDFQHDRVYAFFEPSLLEEVLKRLNYVTGLYSYSKISKCEKDIEQIKELSLQLIEEETKKQITTFKVETKRADKSFPIESTDFSKQLAGKILKEAPYLKVDVHDPHMTLHVELRIDGAYIYMNQIKGLGGFPVPMGGKALVLLSGGIDSPVAAFLAMKKGLQVECIHFESTPLTPIESAQKVLDLASKLARYALHNQIKILFVPFTPMHEQILASIPESYNITIMRRMMLRIATGLLKKRDADAIITGDSVGQVASQTLESLSAIQSATNALIIRPLATYDKLDIISIARQIETFEISNRPFSDCCSIYVSKIPVIRPTERTSQKYELAFDYQTYVDKAVKDTIVFTVKQDEVTDIVSKGFILREVLHENTENEKTDS